LLSEPSALRDFRRAEAINDYKAIVEFAKLHKNSGLPDAPDLSSEVSDARHALDELGIHYSESGTVFKGQYRVFDAPELVERFVGTDTTFGDRPYLMFAQMFRRRNQIAHSTWRTLELYLKQEESRLVPASKIVGIEMDAYALLILANFIRTANRLGRDYPDNLPSWLEMLWKMYVAASARNEGSQ